MRVIEIETPVLWPAEPCRIVCDALLDHRECVVRRWQDGEGDRAAPRCAEEAIAPRVWRVQHSLAAERFERLAEVHRVDAAAARNDRMREHRDAKRPTQGADSTGPKPIKGSRLKSCRTVRCAPVTTATSRPYRTAPIGAA